ncbi:MAG: EAL domain-containing protein [Lachnospiraceae bacterium]|nr:EAL domain-containing protein [Lachnospiraceae bacterium]
MGAQIYLDNYSPVGDITVMAVCMTIFALLFGSYIKKNKNSGIFINIVIYLGLAAIADVIYHVSYGNITNGDFRFVNIIRIIYHALLFSDLLLYVVYIVALLDLKGVRKKIIMANSMALYILVIAGDVFVSVFTIGISTDPANRSYRMINVFLVGYILFLIIIVILTLRYGRHIYKRVMMGFYATIGLSLIILVSQGRHNQNSFTVVSFIPPTIAILYLLHSNPIDAMLGAADTDSLVDSINYYRRIKKKFLFVSLHLKEIDQENTKLPDELRDMIRNTAGRISKVGSLYQLSPGHFIFIARKDRNLDYIEKCKSMLGSVREKLDQFAYTYRIVVGESIDEISLNNEYPSFIRDIEHRMAATGIHIADDSDIKRFRENKYILAQLADICQKNDPDDSRVLAWCQPVYSLKTGKYDTAETLMRLDLPETGIVAPYKFIDAAEQNGYIHTLTCIILKKTCDEIRKLLDEGYDFKRLSVNLSVLDLREEDLSRTALSIIRNAGIPENKIAFEITETQSEYDFIMIKSRIEELKDHGIKFYLDDFGTGFSNMERILELPFDIIKFDRSLVIASDMNARSEKMVGSLAGLFAQLDYAVLYEGIEDQKDEERCRNMSASYLQGYKYSRPIPIGELRNFFEKAEQA